LHDDQQSNPCRQTITAEQQQMEQPHRVKHNYSDYSPLHRHVQCLIVRVPDNFGVDANLADGGLFKEATRGSCAVSDHRSFRSKPQ